MVHSFITAPDTFNVVEKMEEYAQQENKIALILVDEHLAPIKVTYKQLINRANQVANVFKANGLSFGDTVCIMLPKGFEVYTTYIAALKMGLKVVPCSDQLRMKDIEYRLAHSEAKAFIFHEEFIPQATILEVNEGVLLVACGKDKEARYYDEIIPLSLRADAASTDFELAVTSKDHTAFIAYTSGTTGTPKGAIHPHSWGYTHMQTIVKDWLSIDDGDVVWGTAAPGWQKWIWTPFLAVLESGATAVVYKNKFNAQNYLQLIRDLQVNVLCCTPTEYRMMSKVDAFQSADFSTVKSAVSAGEPLNTEVMEKYRQLHAINVRDGYGQTENTLLIGTLISDEKRIGSMGKATPGNRVEILDPFGEVVSANIVGDIAVHRDSPALFKGYFREPERTAMQYRGDWYITGDRAKKDEDGYFWFEGRADDMIISAGYTISPFDIEHVLQDHPSVVECAVVASPDETRGNVVKAYVVLNEQLTPSEKIAQELQLYVKNLLAPFSYPRKIEFLQELPKTMSGKIRRAELRKREQLKNV